MRLITPLVLAISLAAPVAAHAQLNKCVGPDGKVSYQSDPCPDSAKSQSVRPPPPGPSSSGGQGSSGADGWEPERLERMRTGCVAGSLRDAQAAWERGARTDPKMGAFPYSEFKASAESFCVCLVGRVRTSLKPSEFEAKGMATMIRFTNEAFEGGQCRPTGIWARILSGQS
jgi:hypothetical protein